MRINKLKRSRLYSEGLGSDLKKNNDQELFKGIKTFLEKEQSRTIADCKENC